MRIRGFGELRIRPADRTVRSEWIDKIGIDSVLDISV